MPSKTPKQARTMRAAAHDPGFAKKVGIPPSVAKEFVVADEGRQSRDKKAGAKPVPKPAGGLRSSGQRGKR